MEHQPEHHSLAPEKSGSRPSPDITDELLRVLPPPEEAPSLITGLLTDQIHENYFNALAEGREITAPMARAITYCLLAHAPDDAPTAALQRFTATGAGSHAELRAEYLPLSEYPEMVAEGRLLLDVLGTHLFHQEHPDTVIGVNRGSLTPYALDGGLFYTAQEPQRRAAVAFQLPMGLGIRETESLVPFLERNVEKYGGSFRAFLRLPGIDATMPGLITYYLRTRLHPTIAAPLIAGAQPMRATGGDLPAMEAVEIGGQIHAFTR